MIITLLLVASSAAPVSAAVGQAADHTSLRNFRAHHTIRDGPDSPGYLDLAKVARGRAPDHQHHLAYALTTYGTWKAHSLARCDAGFELDFPDADRVVFVSYADDHLQAAVYDSPTSAKVVDVKAWRGSRDSVVIEIPRRAAGISATLPRWRADAASPGRSGCRSPNFPRFVDHAPDGGYTR